MGVGPLTAPASQIASDLGNEAGSALDIIWMGGHQEEDSVGYRIQLFTT